MTSLPNSAWDLREKTGSQTSVRVLATGLKLLDAGVVFERIVAIAVIRPVNDHVPTLTVRPQSLVRQLTHILKAHHRYAWCHARQTYMAGRSRPGWW